MNSLFIYYSNPSSDFDENFHPLTSFTLKIIAGNSERDKLMQVWVRTFVININNGSIECIKETKRRARKQKKATYIWNEFENSFFANTSLTLPYKWCKYICWLTHFTLRVRCTMIAFCVRYDSICMCANEYYFEGKKKWKKTRNCCSNQIAWIYFVLSFCFVFSVPYLCNKRCRLLSCSIMLKLN